MKKIKEQLLTKFILLLVGVVFLVLLSCYILLKSYFAQHNLSLEDLNRLFTQLLFFTFLILPLAYYIYKKLVDRLDKEMSSFRKYLTKIEQKDYEATFQARYFQEFLQLSLHFKNIVKRLHHKDKKKK